MDIASKPEFRLVCAPSQNGSPARDLYLIVQIEPDETFEREGDNLHMDVLVDIFTAVAGGEVCIPGLEQPLTLKIPHTRQRHAPPA